MSLETPLVNTTASAAQEEHGKAKPNATSATAAPPALTFQPTEFLIQESTGQKIGRRGEKKSGMEKREVKIAPELAEQYGNILFEHLQNLLKVTNPQVLDNDSHRHELRLLESLTTDNKPDREKIKEYLETPDGLMISTVLIEDLTSAKIFSMGLHAATQPRGERVEQMPENTIRMQLDQGVLNRVIMDRLVPYLTDNVNATAGRPRGRNIERWRLWLGNTILTAMTGTAVGLTSSIVNNLGHHNLPSALIGLAGAAVVPSIAGIAHLARSGVTIDLRQCSAALESIQHNPDEVAYLNAVLGIDVTNFVVTAPNQIALRPGHALAPNVIRNTQKEIFQGLYAREQFYTSLGIPNEALDALPEQYLYSYEGGRAEQTGTRWQKRLDEIFQPQTAGIRDSAGRAANDPNFLTGGATLDFEGNLRRFTEARRKMMMEMMTKQMIRVNDGEEALDSVTRIKTKITERTEGHLEFTKRKDALSERKKALTKEKTELDSDKTVLDEYITARTTLVTEQRKFETEFEDAFIAGRDINTEMTRINNLLTNHADATSIPARRIAIRNRLNVDLINAYHQADEDLQNEYVGIPIPADVRASIHSTVAQTTKDLYQAELDALKIEEDELKSQRTLLTGIKNNIKEARKILNEKADRIVTSSRENLITMNIDYITLGGWGINDAALRTMSVDELMVQINAANVAIPANGWPEAQNNHPANRARVINAIAEAKAAYDESFDLARNDPDPAVGRLVNYSAVTGWDLNAAGVRITDDQLRNMPRDQIMVLVNQANTHNGGNGWPVVNNRDPGNIRTITLAIDEARNRMVLRHNTFLTTRLADLDSQIVTEQKLIDDINFDNEKDILQTTSDAMLRQGKIFEMAYEVASDNERFTDVNPVDPNDPTFSATERAAFDGAVPPVGYWRLMNVLFGYEKRADRSVYVSKMLKVLPPRALARRINTALGVLPPGHANMDNITIALNQLNTDIGNKTFTGIDVLSMFRDIINGMRMQADAI